MVLLAAQASGAAVRRRGQSGVRWSTAGLQLQRLRLQGGVSRRNTSTESASLSSPPVLRFAPSPTGQLHLGGLRTALFNHLYAKKTGGKWILRIEDTDTKRLVPGAVEAMQDILKWAGLAYNEGPDIVEDNGPYMQSERLDKYARYADQLIQSKHAYRDFREAEKRSNMLASDYIPPDEQETKQLIDAGKQFVVRMRLPKRSTVLDDVVYGKLEFPYDRAIDDPIIVKSDGWPTYHLANVVDDAEMKVTHVLRGEEWLPSVPIHLALYQALGFSPPQFVHLPLLINPDGSKLSKRHADVHVESYRQAGIEPEALINFVALMGSNWHASSPAGPGSNDNSEVFSMSEMVERFDLARISQSRAVPNFEKLRFLNRQFLRRQLADHPDSRGRQDLLNRLATALTNEQWSSGAFPQDRLSHNRLGLVADVMLERSSSIAEMVCDVQALFAPPILHSKESTHMRQAIGNAVYTYAITEGKEMLTALTCQEADDVAAVEAALKSSAKKLNSILAAQGKGLGDSNTGQKKTTFKGRSALLKPLRHALTGQPSGPTVAETIAILGKERCLTRLDASQ